MCELFRRLFVAKSLTDQVDKIDRRQRIIRHDLKNIQMQASALERLIRRMRDDGTIEHRRG